MTRIKALFINDSAPGILLFCAAVLAMIAANGPWAADYQSLLGLPLRISVGELPLIHKPVSLWINDGLMAIFFFLIGMEIKREWVKGELASFRQALLPLIAAVGGVVVPALIYAYFNAGNPEAMRGWAIPCATDIAFSLGVLALLGSRVPLGIKVFLTAVAVIDDLMAILIIAFFYTDTLALDALQTAGIGIVGLGLLHLFKIRAMPFYLLFGLVLWYGVLKSGIHATIAGVLLGLFIPLRLTNTHGETLLEAAEHALKPWVNFLILPIFAFANAGIPFDGITLETATQPIPLGIAVGLFVGKQIGIFAATALTIGLGFARMPSGSNWLQLYGVSILAGIGFTMSLFVGSLAFPDPAMQNYVRLGVMGGSLVSTLVGYAVLRYALRPKP